MMATLMSKRWALLAAGLSLAAPAHAIDWNGMLKGVLGKPAASGVDALSTAVS